MRRSRDRGVFGASLSARVLWLTIGIILLVEMITLMPNLGRERQDWLWTRVTEAHLAAYSAMAAGVPGGTGVVDAATQAKLLQLIGADSIRLRGQGAATFAFLTKGAAVAGDAQVALGQEGFGASLWQADLAVLGLGPKRLEVVAKSPLQNGVTVDVTVSGQALGQHLRRFVRHVAAISVILAVLTGFLVFAALDRLLVRPMHVLTASIAGFRQDPESGEDSELARLGRGGNDEISAAARELAEMEEELRAALWRNARLAAVGTAVAKISHDLRNILASALLVADRLQETADPLVKRAAGTLIGAVERAADLVSRTADFAREGPPAIIRAPVGLYGLIDEVIAAGNFGDTVTVENQVPADVVMALDPAQMSRVLVNLLRNAGEAGATKVRFSIECVKGLTRLLVADNGPGLPLPAQDNLFRPFTGTGRRGGAGLGLAIARDLMRAHGGDLVLRRTGPRGTEFILGLAADALAEPPDPDRQERQVARQK